MKIIKGSIKNISSELSEFLKQLHGCDYVVYGEMITFNYLENETQFNLSLMEEIYFEFSEKVSGKINMVPWDKALNDINEKLQYTPYGTGEDEAKDIMLDLVANFEHENRKKKFWEIVKNNLNLPPEKTYFYEDYLSTDVMWGFCYIFLKDGKGLVLHAGASD